MVGFICFFIEEHLWFGYGAPFVVKATQKCQDIFLNNFLTTNGHEWPMLEGLTLAHLPTRSSAKPDALSRRGGLPARPHCDWKFGNFGGTTVTLMKKREASAHETRKKTRKCRASILFRTFRVFRGPRNSFRLPPPEVQESGEPRMTREIRIRKSRIKYRAQL
jgi:hypothetical protein